MAVGWQIENWRQEIGNWHQKGNWSRNKDCFVHKSMFSQKDLMKTYGNTFLCISKNQQSDNPLRSSRRPPQRNSSPRTMFKVAPYRSHGTGPVVGLMFVHSFEVKSNEQRWLNLRSKGEICYLIEGGFPRVAISTFPPGFRELYVYASDFRLCNLPNSRFRSCLNSDFLLKKSKIAIFRLAKITHSRFPPDWEIPPYCRIQRKLLSNANFQSPNPQTNSSMLNPRLIRTY